VVLVELAAIKVGQEGMCKQLSRIEAQLEKQNSNVRSNTVDIAATRQWKTDVERRIEQVEESKADKSDVRRIETGVSTRNSLIGDVVAAASGILAAIVARALGN